MYNLSNISYRPALISDAERISKFVEEVHFVDESPHSKADGFLVYMQHVKDCSKRIGESSHCILAEDSEELLGFIIAYSTDEIRTLECNLAYQGHLLDEFLHRSNDEDIFVDQVAVSKKVRHLGLATQLIRRLPSSTLSRREFGAVAHFPVRNCASYGFYKQLGAHFVSEVPQEPWRWGLYAWHGVPLNDYECG